MLQVWSALLTDASAACGFPVARFALDRARAERGVTTRGLGFLTLDLPSLDAMVTDLLETGSIACRGPLGTRKSKKDVRPRFLWDLWTLVCDSTGMLLSSPSPDAITYLRQISCLFKKYEVACSPSRINTAVKEYYAIDHQIQKPTLSWTDDEVDIGATCTFADRFDEDPCELFAGINADRQSENLVFAQRLDRVAAILVSELGSFDSMSEDSRDNGWFKHGPGAVSNLKGGSYKYEFPCWSDKLERVFPFDWCASEVLGGAPASRSEHPSALLAVPKTAKAPRLIASEPVEHQWCQQKVASWLECAFSRTLAGKFIDIRNQALSQRLVVLASKDRSLSTIDLSSASDRVACWHIERLLDKNKPLLEAVHAVRTRYIEDRVSKRDAFVLRKFASMGSALTFPMQCLFFLAVALASCGCENRRDISRMVGKVRVFGDDIIVPSSSHASVVRDLEVLGLKVNAQKSFVRGHFRESCGQDSWGGFDVTPVKPKSLDSYSPTKVTAMVDTANNLYLKGHWYAAEAVMGLLPARFKTNIFCNKEVDEDGRVLVRDPGLISVVGAKYGRVKRDQHLHIDYVLQPTSQKRMERIAPDSSVTLREFFTRPYSADMPRQLGVTRSAAAKFATVRVQVEHLVGA